MFTQNQKGQLFRSLHERDGAFIIPNPWDIGTAARATRLEALASTSAGYAFSVGQQDNSVGREASGICWAMAQQIPVIEKITITPTTASFLKHPPAVSFSRTKRHSRLLPESW